MVLKVVLVRVERCFVFFWVLSLLVIWCCVCFFVWMVFMSVLNSWVNCFEFLFFDILRCMDRLVFLVINWFSVFFM